MEISGLILLIFLPIALGLVNLILPKLWKKIVNTLVLSILVYIIISSFISFTNGGNFTYHLGNTLILEMDILSVFTLIFIQIMSFIIFVFSLKGLEAKAENYFLILFPIAVGISNGVVLSVNTISFLIFWGLSGLILYLFANLGNNNPDTAKKTLLYMGGGDALLILGLVLVRFLKYGQGWSLLNLNIVIEGELAYISFLSLAIAAFTKAGVFPFHTWLPDFSKDSQVESAAFLPSSLDKLLGIYLLARVVFSVFELNFGMNLFLMTIGALSIITAVMMALIQHDGRKLLGYHAVSQVGYMVLGIGSGSLLALAGGLFHLINNVIYKTGLFLSLGSVEKKTGTSNLDKMGGLGNKMPATFSITLILALAISGIPPLNGFFSKWMIYQGLIEKASGLAAGYQIWVLICLILAAFGSALTLASFLKFTHTIFLGKNKQEHSEVDEAPFNQIIAGAVLAISCLGLGIFGKEIILNRFIYPITSQFASNVPTFIGLYQPVVLVLLFALIFLVGFLIYILVKRVKYADNYIGGMEPIEKFRVVGTAFYKEIKNMSPLKTIYKWAENKIFDIYYLGKKVIVSFGSFFSDFHTGELRTYNLWIALGILLLLFIMK